MANNISTTQLVANAVLAEFMNNNSLLVTGARTYESDFSMADYQLGDSVQIRKQNVFNVEDGRVANLQDVSEEVETLTINHQYNVAYPFNSRELSLFVNTGEGPFNERYIRPVVQEIVKRAEQDIAIQAVNELNFAVGAPGTPINSYAAVDQAAILMQEMGMPLLPNAYCALNPRDAGALRASLQNNFNDTLNEDISFQSSLGRLGFFDMFTNQSLPRHVAGSGAGTVLVNGAVTSGNTIVMDGATPSAVGVFKKGDVISFGTFGASPTDALTGAVNSLNPIGRLETGQLMQFVVLADADADVGGNVIITIGPSVVSDVADPRRNVSQAIFDNATVNLLGANSTYNVNLAYGARGLDIVIPPMAILSGGIEGSIAHDKDVNVSLRVQRGSDINNDLEVLRTDMLIGSKWHAQYATKLVS